MSTLVGPESVALCGLRITPLTFDQLADELFVATSTTHPKVVGHVNLHGVYLANKDAGMLKFYNATATLNYVDGSSVILLSRLRRMNLTMDQCVTFVDKFEPMLREASQRGKRIFYLGSTPESVAKMREEMAARLPDLQLEVSDGYFDKESKESDEVIERINAAQPDLLMVGFGMPIQERWIAANLDKFRVPVITTVGATADYVAGTIATPPKWAGRLGLYWLFRLLSDPKRLWRRYLLEPWSALFSFFRWGGRIRPAK